MNDHCIRLALAAVSFAIIGSQPLYAQPSGLERTEVLKVDVAEMEGKEAHMWVAEIAPGAATATHTHPTTRFVFVMEGSVEVEIDGKSTQTFQAGEGFQEVPDVAPTFRNASTTESAKALGFQIAGKDQPLQK